MQESLSRYTALKQEILDRIRDHHLRPWDVSRGNIFFISDAYPGVWLEHTFDAVVWADYCPADHEVSRNQVRLFLDRQKPDGQLPCYIWKDKIGYSQLQECVSFGSLCLDAVRQNPQDETLLADCYDGVSAWISWQEKHRMTQKKGLIEMFCGYDTGHDNSGRFAGMRYPENICEDAAAAPADDDVLPVIAPDINACYYGDLRALAGMARKLNRSPEAQAWDAEAERVRKALFDICFDPVDRFFYDVDKNGNKRKIRSISVTNVLTEGIPDQALADEIFSRYLWNPKEFRTPYPFPAVSSGDPAWVQNRKGNSWGFYSQGLTCLRTLRWMERYGYGKEMREIMALWVRAWADSTTTRCGQELHPLTGVPSDCSQYYSSCMLYLLVAMRTLYGI